MKVGELREGHPGGFVSEHAFRITRDGEIKVDLEAEVVQTDVAEKEEPRLHPIQIRRNFELILPPGAPIRHGSKSLIEVPEEELRDRLFKVIETVDPERWAEVTPWRPWRHTWSASAGLVS